MRITQEELLKVLNLEKYKDNIKVVSSRFNGLYASLKRMFENIVSANPKYTSPSRRTYLIEVPEEYFVDAAKTLVLLNGLLEMYGNRIEELNFKD